MPDDYCFASDYDFERIKMFYRNGFKNRRYAMRCIFHLDNGKSLKVSGDRYNCYGCNKSGTTSSLITKISGILGKD